jgi:hypothetical protein
MRNIYFLFIITILFIGCNSSAQNGFTDNNIDSVVKIELNLSAFGVESDDFPSIYAVIDLVNKTSECKKSYYAPSKQNSTYFLSISEINTIIEILQNKDLEKFKKEYKINKTDQPRSIMIIYTKKRKFTIDDYGLESDTTLNRIYNIVYKL